MRKAISLRYLIVHSSVTLNALGNDTATPIHVCQKNSLQHRKLTILGSRLLSLSDLRNLKHAFQSAACAGGEDAEVVASHFRVGESTHYPQTTTRGQNVPSEVDFVAAVNSPGSVAGIEHSGERSQQRLTGEGFALGRCDDEVVEVGKLSLRV